MDQYPLDAVACDLLFMLTCAILMTSSHSEGRFVVGIAVGVASMAVPLYIAELAPSHARGRYDVVRRQTKSRRPGRAVVLALV